MLATWGWGLLTPRRSQCCLGEIRCPETAILGDADCPWAAGPSPAPWLPRQVFLDGGFCSALSGIY